MPVDNHVKRMLEELKLALVQAIRSSSGVTETVRKIREQGFDLHLVLSFDQGDDSLDRTGERPSSELQAIASTPKGLRESAGGERATGRRKLRHQIDLTPREAPAWVPAGRSSRSSAASARKSEGRPPDFRLSGYDVTLLKSLGIDPTRKGRQARKRPPGPSARGGKRRP